MPGKFVEGTKFEHFCQSRLFLHGNMHDYVSKMVCLHHFICCVTKETFGGMRDKQCYSNRLVYCCPIRLYAEGFNDKHA